MSITQKLVILFLAISLAPLSILSLLVYNTLTKGITETSNVAITRVADKQKLNINNILESDNATTISFATLYDLRQIFASYLLTKDQQDKTKLRGILNTATTTAADVVDITLTDLQGQVVASTNQKLLTTNVKNQTYFNNTYDITMINDPDDSTSKLYFKREITSDEKTLGYIFVTFATYRIEGVLQDYTGLGDTGQTILAQKYKQNENIIISPDRFNKDAAFKATITKQPLSLITDAFYPNLVDQNGHAIVAVTRVVPQAGWEMIVTMDVAEILAPINPLRNIIIFMLLISSIIVTLLALYFARLFTAPIITLTEKTKFIIQGDLNQRIESNSSDEIGKLAASFNIMTEKLKQSYSGLEEKVREKTKELTETVTILGQEKMKDEAILESIGDGMLVTDNNGNIMLMNKVAHQMLNLQNTTYFGKSAYVLFQLQQLDNTPVLQENRPLSIAFKTRKKFEDTYNFVEGNEKKFVVNITATPVIENDQVIGIVEILRDITKEKEIDRMKTEFISLASHQLRTPLSAIKWFSEMLVGGDAGKLTDEQQDFAQNIRESTQRMIELVNSILNISRIESGRILIDPQPTDLKELVQNIVKELQVKITERQQNLIISVHADLPKINLDQKLIRQVYMNLLTNAIKYTPKGGEITIIISKKDTEIVSQIADNGYGIPKAQQGKIFQKFFRAENIIKVETDGTGLGLYLIKAIIDSSRGKIWFESEENKGTTFWFSLPIAGMQAKKGEVTLDE